MNTIVNETDIPIISIIVPVYNTKQYLEQCLNSLRVQSFDSIEIIVIDDGSTDGSGIICDRFARLDSRFKIVHEENSGLAAVRNHGISLARGKYIMFVDSDDWVEPSFCEKPFRAAVQTGSDLIVFRYAYENGKHKSISTFFHKGISSKDKALTQFWQQTRAYAWNKMYKRNLFRNIQYPVGRLFEDDAVTHEIVYNAESIFFLDECLYHYRVLRKGSITSNASRKQMEDYFYCNFRRIDDLKQYGYEYKGEEAKLSISYLAIFGRNAELSLRCKITLKDKSCFKNSSASWRRSIMFKVYQVSPLLFDIISIVTGKRIRV